MIAVQLIQGDNYGLDWGLSMRSDKVPLEI